MSYILDALRKSESERRQGRAPDLGVSVQMVHKPRRRRVHWSVWVTLALMVNAAVLGFVLLRRGHSPHVLPAAAAGKAAPGTGSSPDYNPPARDKSMQARTVAANPAVASDIPEPAPKPAQPARTSAPASHTPAPHTIAATAEGATTSASTGGELSVGNGETVIRPHGQTGTGQNLSGSGAHLASAKVPQLGDLPRDFQRHVPDLHFNGHIYSSSPGARRVIINNVYLGEGDTYQGLTIDRITPDGVVMSMDGRQFRVGVVKDWIQPN